MAAMRMQGRKGIIGAEINGGDLALLGENLALISTVGAGVIDAASMLNGVIYRSGSTGAYTDAVDTAENILALLAGENDSGGALVPGLSFRVRIINGVNFTQTLTWDSSFQPGNGTVSVATIAGNSWRDFLFVFASVQPPVSYVANFTTGTHAVNFALAPGQSAVGQGPRNIGIMPGAHIQGSGIANNATVSATVTGVVEVPGGISGVTISNSTNATKVNSAVSFGPLITYFGIGGGTL